MWYSVNGERLGTYNGHTGAVWCVDCDCILLQDIRFFMFYVKLIQHLYSCGTASVAVLAGVMHVGLLNMSSLRGH